MCLYLPRYPGHRGEVDKRSPRDADAVAGDGETVLVVDDEPTVRMLIVEVLEEPATGPSRPPTAPRPEDSAVRRAGSIC